MRVAGKQSAEVRVPSGSGPRPAYVWQDATALVLAPGVSPDAVMRALGGIAKPVAGVGWADELLKYRNVLVVEHGDAAGAKQVADLAKGLIEGTGRIAFFDKGGQNVAVYRNRFLIEPNGRVQEPALAAEAKRHGFTLQSTSGNRYLIAPVDPAEDALDVARRAQQLAASPLVRPNSLIVDWITPVQRR